MKIILAEKPFLSIQGEGNYIGVPGIFIRFSGCNLQCPKCDTKYHKEGFETTTEEVINQILELKDETKCIIFTGGEPLLNSDAIIEIMLNLKPRYRTRNSIPSYDFWWCQIETNGTINPEVVSKELESDTLVQYNISPKLKSFNQEGNKIELYKYWRNIPQEHILKFVTEEETDIEEIKKITKELNIRKERVYLMAEGASKKEQEENMKKIIPIAIKYGYNFTPRLHILLWDIKRGV